MKNRKRNVQIIVRVMDEERVLIEDLGDFPGAAPAGEACEGTSKNGQQQTGILRERQPGHFL